MPLPGFGMFHSAWWKKNGLNPGLSQNHNGFMEEMGFFHLKLKKLDELSKMSCLSLIVVMKVFWLKCHISVIIL